MLQRPVAAGTRRSDSGQGARAHRPAAPGPQTISTDARAVGGRAGGAAVFREFRGRLWSLTPSLPVRGARSRTPPPLPHQVPQHLGRGRRCGVTRGHHADSAHPCGGHEARDGSFTLGPGGEGDPPLTAASPPQVAAEAGTELSWPPLRSQITRRQSTVQLAPTAAAQRRKRASGPFPEAATKSYVPEAGEIQPTWRSVM